MAISSKTTNQESNSWTIDTGRVVFWQHGKSLHLSASDIVRIEFKGHTSVKGFAIPCRPSEELSNINFNRFPIGASIELGIPNGAIGKSSCNTTLLFNGSWSKFPLSKESDQVIIDDNWFPLVTQEVSEIFQELELAEIPVLGDITLHQCLQLARSASSLVRVGQAINSSEHISNLSQQVHHGLNATLYPYQETGVSWLTSISREDFGCILADEMGLGKTLQIIALISLNCNLSSAITLVLCPATLLENWRREIEKFAPHISVLVHAGTNRTGFPSKLNKFDVVISSYDTAVRDQGMFVMIRWSFVVLDEAQAIKNPETQRSKAVKSLPRKVSLAVTGTPVENRLMDLWSIMDFSCPGLLGTRNEFETAFDDNQDGARRLEQIVSPLILRRRVADVADDLPQKIIIPQAIPMGRIQANEYERLRERIVEEYGNSATLVSLVKLRQFCAHPNLITKNSGDLLLSSKYSRLLELLEEISANNEKVIIFTSFTLMTDILSTDLTWRFSVPSMVLDGRTPVQDRQPTIDRFSDYKSTAILILNPRAAGTGLNITAANHVIHYNLEWNPAIEDQATARAYRRGQDLPVTVHRLFHPGTVEEVINDRLTRKRELAETAILGTEGEEMDTADIAKAMIVSPGTNWEGFRE